MTKVELSQLLERLLKETDRRRGLGGYSADAPGIYDLYQIVAQLTLQLMQIEGKLNRLTRKK